VRESLHPVGARVLGSTSHAPRDDRFSLPSRVHNQQTNSDALSRDASILSNSAASIGQQGNNTLYTDLGLLLLILLFGGSSKLRSKPFTPWLWGSNQIEHMFSEWRSFEHGNTTWSCYPFDVLPPHAARARARDWASYLYKAYIL